MNKYALSLAGGALLATTALATGTVSAATIKTSSSIFGVAGGPGTVPGTLTAAGLASDALTATSSAVTLGPRTYFIDSGARLQIQSTVVLNVTGGEFDTTVTPNVTLYDQSSGGTLEAPTVTVGAAAIASGAGVTMFTDKILISNVDNNTSTTYGGIELSGVVFRQAQSLATAGSSLALSGSIQNAAQTTTLEAIDSKNVITSKGSQDVRSTTGSALTISSSTTPIFTGVIVAAANTTSASLATVVVSTSASVSTDLSTVLVAASTISTIEVKLTHAVLNDPAVTEVTLATSGGVITKSPLQFSAGTVTFSPSVADILTTARAIRVSFNGTTAITAAAAGTVGLTMTAKAPALTALTSAGSAASALTRGGLNTTFNLVQNSTAAFASFIRVANTGGTAGNVTITVRNSSTGQQLGNTYSSPSISSGGSIQVSAKDIETGAGITAVSGTTYDITVTGAIAGFAQHIGFNSANGGLSDLSSFRNGGAANP